MISKSLKDTNLKDVLKLVAKAEELDITDEKTYAKVLEVFKALEQVFLHEDDYDPEKIQELKEEVIYGSLIWEMTAFNPSFDKVIENSFPNLDITLSLEFAPVIEKRSIDGMSEETFKTVFSAMEKYLEKSEGINPKHIAKLREFISTSNNVRKFIEKDPNRGARMPQILDCVENQESMELKEAVNLGM